MKLTQLQFARKLAIALGVTEGDSQRIINAFKAQIYSCLKNGEVVELSGFGQFSVSHRAPREGIHPRTLQKMTIPELNTPKFKSGEAFKKAIAFE